MPPTPIVVLATAWGSREGGINVFNAEMCVALAELLASKQQLICVVPGADGNTIADAAKRGVTLIQTGQTRLEDSGAVTVALRENGVTDVAWWIGHDVITGEVALQARRLAGTGRVALIHHMSYLQYTAYKHGQGSAAVSRWERQQKLFDSCDQTFGVGPLLRDSLRNDLLSAGRPEPVMLIPGLPEIAARDPGQPFTAIIFGRLDKADDRIKQGRLAIAGIARARRAA